MAEDWGGNHFGIDLSPGPDGRRGQVINFGRDEDLKVVMAPNLEAFIAWMAGELDGGGGKAVADGKGKIDFELADPPGLHFLDAAKARFGPAK